MTLRLVAFNFFERELKNIKKVFDLVFVFFLQKKLYMCECITVQLYRELHISKELSQL